MNTNQVKIGTTYQTKVANQPVEVLILRKHRSGGWEAKNLSNNKIIRIKTATRLNLIAQPIETAPQPIEVVEPAVVEQKAVAPSDRKSKTVYVAPTSAIAGYKPGDDILQLVNLLGQGVTKAQICTALGWKDWNPRKTAVLKLGYGICSDAEGRFWLVEAVETVANVA
ncbi:MAG: hypothetical protein DCF22_18205 [Leptolyngbya sp.]|nr:MAG: hypothetical protein DCF22_18205 [Leptolyngbya sp.]